MLESRTIACHLTTQNIAHLAGLDARDVDKALSDPQAVPIEQRYGIAMRCSYLINSLHLAGNR